jgi:hypothetical protein
MALWDIEEVVERELSGLALWRSSNVYSRPDGSLTHW